MSARGILAGLLLLVMMIPVSAVTYSSAANAIMFKSPLGMLIPLGIENYLAPEVAIMYYNYIAAGFIMLTAAMSGQSNESRFTFLVPLMAALMYFIGWFQAPDLASQFGIIIGCMLLGALMYINDMNHEKFGLPGPGTKVISIAMMIIVFEASVVLVSSPSLNLFPEIGNDGAMKSQQGMMCGGYGYTCDANGNIDLSASVSSVTGSGGTSLDAVSVVMWAAGMLVAMIRFIILVLGAVVLFSVVLVATYPVLLSSPLALLILGIFQIVIWAVYMMAFFNWGFKPSYETARI